MNDSDNMTSEKKRRAAKESQLERHWEQLLTVRSGQPYSLAIPLSRARHSIECCVVSGGNLFSDPDAYKALCGAGERGVDVRVLFPSVHSAWLRDLSWPSNLRPEVHPKIISDASEKVKSLGGKIRLYDAPGPCWFILIDREILYTKPLSISHISAPIQEDREHFINHFSSLYDELWTRASEMSAPYEDTKHGTPIITCVPLAPNVISRFVMHPSIINQISPESFELLVADRLSAMGMGVQRVGATRARDGGIDLLAWPAYNFALPFLLAVQIKHSRSGSPVGSRTVRDLKGILSSVPIDIGMIVTNTRFTADAKWVAAQGPSLVRLRDLTHLLRWLRSSFSDEEVLLELPREIHLAPGLRVVLNGLGDKSGIEET